MNYGRQLHPDDSTSTYLLVKKLQEEDFNIVLVYKPQGDQVVIGPKIYDELDVRKNLFAIGLQTKQHLDMFIKHGKKIVCIESTHETNRYEFPLVTLVAADEFNKGYTVGFFISMVHTVVRRIFHKFKKVMKSPIEAIDHTLQRDSRSCGVYVCYYAEQIAKGE